MADPIYIAMKVPIYSVRIYVAVGASADQLMQYFKTKKVKLTATDTEAIRETIEPNNEAFAYQLEDAGRFLIWLSKYDKSPRRIQALVHEITHTTLHIFEHIDAEITNSSHEPLCYLHDYITGECLKRLSKLV